MLLPATKRAYSLVELLVVIGVITIVGLASIPNIFNRNDRLMLDSSANQIRQYIIDARTRSLAPTRSDTSSSAQMYQVVFGVFTQGSESNSATGSATTNEVSLERGLAQCDSGDIQGGFSTLRQLKLPRGIFVSKFYPSNQQETDDRAVIRFSVGQEGFVCGSYGTPSYRSTRLYEAGWSGKLSDSSATTARYLIVELSSNRISDKRYVALDRISGEVSIHRTNPQGYFTPVVDQLAPRWTDTALANFTLTISCGSSSSEVVISYPRARDRVEDPNSPGDPNLIVLYDLSWDLGAGSQTLALSYFHDLTDDLVRYAFTTDSFTIGNQPRQVTVTVAAIDGVGRKQPAFDSNSPTNDLNQRQKLFTPSCGSRIPDEKEEPDDPDNDSKQDDPGGNAQACDPIVRGDRRFFAWRLVLPKAKAVVSNDLCEVETGI